MSKIGVLPEGNYVTLDNGHKIHYLDEGSGPALVFLHGSGPGASGYSNFKQNYPLFVEHGYRVLIPDHLGYGFSDKPDDIEYPLELFVECIIKTMDAVGIDACSLVGNSLGGAIAIKMALDYPERIERMVLMAPGGIEDQPAYFEMQGMANMREFFMSGQELTFDNMKEVLKNLVYDPAHITDGLVEERKQIFEIQNNQVMATMKVQNMQQQLGDIQCPVLGFWGVNETFMPLTGIMKLAQGCKDIRMVVQSRCGHWFMLEHEAVFNRTCLDFLQNC